MAYAANTGKRSIAQNPLRISDAGDSILKGSRVHGCIGIHPPGIERQEGECNKWLLSLFIRHFPQKRLLTVSI
jgi:hypothetical protein